MQLMVLMINVQFIHTYLHLFRLQSVSPENMRIFAISTAPTLVRTKFVIGTMGIAMVYVIKLTDAWITNYYIVHTSRS